MPMYVHMYVGIYTRDVDVASLRRLGATYILATLNLALPCMNLALLEASKGVQDSAINLQNSAISLQDSAITVQYIANSILI